MLLTLIELGKQLSSNRNEWEDIIDLPNIAKEKEKGIDLVIANVIFDVDAQEIRLELGGTYEERKCRDLKNIRIQGGNNKAIYVCVESGKLDQLKKTFFGKENTDTKGEFATAIDQNFVALKDTVLYNALEKVFALRDAFLAFYSVVDEEKTSKSKNNDIIYKNSENALLESLDLGKSKVVLIYASIVCAELQIHQPTLFSELKGFDGFMRAKFLDKHKKAENAKKTTSKLCYASGKMSDNVIEPDFAERYSLNKMFVKETKNYASNFDANNFGKNYQLDAENQQYLSRASNFILGKLKIRIAGIDHCIIPQFINASEVDMQYRFESIVKNNELLFGENTLDKLATGIERETDDPYWITYLAFESDGNFFKTINEIKDVSKLHFITMLEKLQQTNKIFSEDLAYAVDWESATKEYGKSHSFNFKTLYSIIPIRKNIKKNDVLALFKLIFEKGIVDKNTIYRHFCELVLCHYYERYGAYANIQTKDVKYLDFSIRDAVFKYLALFHFLNQLNPPQNMENQEEKQEQKTDVPSTYWENVEGFFVKMNYNDTQKAMFYLGRMMSKVIRMQEGKKMTVLEKVNFNGMNKEAIVRFQLSLIEKAQQYGEAKGLDSLGTNFTQYFNFNDWSMKPEEAVFFLLSGYSFGIIKKNDKNNSTDNSTDNNAK